MLPAESLLFFLALLFPEFGVHHIFLLAGLGLFGARGLLGARRLRGLGLGVHLLGHLVRGFHQRVGFLLDVVLVLPARGFLEFLHRGLDFFLFHGLELLAHFLYGLAHAVHQAVAVVAGLGQLARLVVFLGVRLGVLHHLLDFRLAQAGTGLDGDLVFLVGGLVLGRHVQNAIGVNIEADIDLRHAARRRRNVTEVETAERLVARGHFALALQHVHRHRRLAVAG